jgi:CRP-like cAMP-binding protein
MPRQKPTNPDTPDWTLTPQQETAVDLLASGKTVTDAATAVEVTRQTVSEWLNHHPGFQAALNRRRQELWIGMTQTLRGLLPKALEVLKDALEGEHPLPAAVHVLKACGLYGNVSPLGPTEVEDALLAEQERQSERRRKTLMAAAW